MDTEPQAHQAPTESKSGLTNGSELKSHPPVYVTLCLLCACVAIVFCIWAGEGLVTGNGISVAAASSATTLFPSTDLFIQKYKLQYHVIPLILALPLLIVFVTHKNGDYRPLHHFCNTVAFFEITICAMLWTAHTGGISASIYGPAYLSLFSVAMIIPKTAGMKALAAVPVAVGAILMSSYAPDVGREFFICILSMLGTFLGVLIRWFLTRSLRPLDNA